MLGVERAQDVARRAAARLGSKLHVNAVHVGQAADGPHHLVAKPLTLFGRLDVYVLKLDRLGIDGVEPHFDLRENAIVLRVARVGIELVDHFRRRPPALCIAGLVFVVFLDDAIGPLGLDLLELLRPEHERPAVGLDLADVEVVGLVPSDGDVRVEARVVVASSRRHEPIMMALQHWRVERQHGDVTELLQLAFADIGHVRRLGRDLAPVHGLLGVADGDVHVVGLKALVEAVRLGPGDQVLGVDQPALDVERFCSRLRLLGRHEAAGGRELSAGKVVLGDVSAIGVELAGIAGSGFDLFGVEHDDVRVDRVALGLDDDAVVGLARASGHDDFLDDRRLVEVGLHGSRQLIGRDFERMQRLQVDGHDARAAGDGLDPWRRGIELFGRQRDAVRRVGIDARLARLVGEVDAEREILEIRPDLVLVESREIVGRAVVENLGRAIVGHGFAGPEPSLERLGVWPAGPLAIGVARLVGNVALGERPLHEVALDDALDLVHADHFEGRPRLDQDFALVVHERLIGSSDQGRLLTLLGVDLEDEVDRALAGPRLGANLRRRRGHETGIGDHVAGGRVHHLVAEGAPA